MMKPFFFVTSSVLLLLIGCSARPIVSTSELPLGEKIKPEIIETRSLSGEKNEISFNELKHLNEKAGKPSFGLIMGFYQLPSTKPAGAVLFEESNVFGRSYRSFWFKDSFEKPYAVLPAAPLQLEVLVSAMNKLLNAGIEFKEVSMTDAVKIMKAEQEAIKSNKTWLVSRTLPSGVDLLISLQKGFSENGLAYSGRVISTKDGRLLALATWPDISVYSLKPLIHQLVVDSLRRLVN